MLACNLHTPSLKYLPYPGFEPQVIQGHTSMQVTVQVSTNYHGDLHFVMNTTLLMVAKHCFIYFIDCSPHGGKLGIISDIRNFL